MNTTHRAFSVFSIRCDMGREQYTLNKRGKFRIGTIVTIGILVYMCMILVDQQKLLYAKKNEMASVQESIKNENRLKESLINTQKMLDTDEYLEKIAREQYGMVKPGEKVFVDADK